MTELPGKELAQELINQSRAESRKTPMEAVIQAVQEGGFDAEQTFRLLGRLWTLERMFYYIYGGWGQGLEVNDFPPSVKYFFSRQIVDESTHEMLYMDAMLRQGWVSTQKGAYPGCTVCLMYCPAEASIIEVETGRSLVPPPPDVWQELGTSSATA